jgi:hypothetical protein
MSRPAVALLVASFVLCAVSCATPVPRSLSVAAPPDHPRVYIDVHGMDCPVRCPLEVLDQLRAAPGVTAAAVDFDSSTALCAVLPGTAFESVVAALHPPYSGRLLAR